MSEKFFKQPILNSPYELPTQHHDLDDEGQPTGKINDGRRASKFITPVPRSRKRRSKGVGQAQLDMTLSDAEGITVDVVT